MKLNFINKFIERIPTWIFVGILFFGFGTVAVFLLNYSLFSKDGNFVESLKSSSELCLSNNFPGKSVSIEELNFKNRSIFDDEDFFTYQNDEFYSAFEEERFEKEKFFNGKAFPEIAMADEIYRFFWLRTFHNPVMIKVYRIRKNEQYIVVKRLSGKSGYEMGSLILNQTRRLDNDEWCKFISLLNKADFWNKEKTETTKLANDGAFWIIEGISERRYYSAGEQSPKTGNFRDACIYLMRISGLDLNENDQDFY